MIIWGRPNSINVKKVLWTAAELKLTFENKKAGGAYGGLDNPEFLALNPNGRVPVLQDDNLALWESDAIVRYLASHYSNEDRPALYIKDAITQAKADQWMCWASTKLMPFFRDIMAHAVRLPQNERQPEVLAAATKGFGDAMKIANETLNNSKWIAGDHMSVGDINLGSFIYCWFEIPLDREPLPALEAYYQNLKNRPAYREHVMLPIT